VVQAPTTAGCTQFGKPVWSLQVSAADGSFAGAQVGACWRAARSSRREASEARQGARATAEGRRRRRGRPPRRRTSGRLHLGLAFGRAAPFSPAPSPVRTARSTCSS
jgi:hypothetical protein